MSKTDFLSRAKVAIQNLGESSETSFHSFIHNFSSGKKTAALAIKNSHELRGIPCYRMTQNSLG